MFDWSTQVPSHLAADYYSLAREDPQVLITTLEGSLLSLDTGSHDWPNNPELRNLLQDSKPRPNPRLRDIRYRDGRVHCIRWSDLEVSGRPWFERLDSIGVE